MAFNRDEDDQRAVKPGDGVLPGTGSGAGSVGEVQGGVQGEVHGGVQPPGSALNALPESVPEPEVNAEEERRARDFARWRGRFHDVPDSRFDQVVQDLQVPLPIAAIARGLVQEGYCAHLHPASVRLYLKEFRNAMGWPRYSDLPEPPDKVVKEDELEELIEESPVMKRLGWLIRIQQSRVRKALNFESQMANMVLPMASSEIKLLADLMDKEIEIAMKTGSLKTVPQAVTFDTEGLPVAARQESCCGLDPAAAFRVVLAARRLRALLAENPDPDGEPGDHAVDVSPGSDSAEAASIDGRVDAGGGDAVGTSLPGAAESGPVEPAPGVDGEHGRT